MIARVITIAALLALCSEVSCAADSNGVATAAQAPLAASLDGDWRLVEIDGHAAPDGVTLKFTNDGISGRGGCNRYFGTVTPGNGPGTVQFGAIGATRMSCGDILDGQERVFLKALAEVGRFLITPAAGTVPARLTLRYGTSRPPNELVFERLR